MGNFGGGGYTRYDDSDDAKNTPIGPTNLVDIDGQNGWIKRTYIIDPSLEIPDLFRPLVRVQKETNVYLQGRGVDVDLWIVGHKDSEESQCESKKGRSLPKKRTTICVGSRDSQMKDREAVTVRIQAFDNIGPISVDVGASSGSVTVLIPRSFHGPVALRFEGEDQGLSAEILKNSTPFGMVAHTKMFFVGDYPAVFGADSVWEGDELKVRSSNGVTVKYVDEVEQVQAEVSSKRGLMGLFHSK